MSGGGMHAEGLPHATSEPTGLLAFVSRASARRGGFAREDFFFPVASVTITAGKD